MEMMRMTETTKRQSYWWWFDSHNNGPGRSQWLQSALSELDEKTKAMLRIIEEDADSFAQRAEMYYKKRPQLVGMVEDFYRAHRSLAEQFDHLRHDPSTRRTSPLARSFSLTTSLPEKVIDLHKSYASCFTKLAYDSEDLLSSPSSKGSSEKSLDPLKPFDGRYTELAYDYEESIDSEVDDPVLEVNYEALDLGEELSSAQDNHADLMAEIERLREENMMQKKQIMEKDKAMENLNQKLSESLNVVMELKEEAEKLRMENVEMYLLKMKDAEEREAVIIHVKEEKEQLIIENVTLNKLLLQKDEEKREIMKQLDEMKKLREELGSLQMENQEQREMLEEKDEEKREAIRQLSVAIEMLKGENLLLKKSLVHESNRRWNPFEFQMLKGFGKLFKCSMT